MYASLYRRLDMPVWLIVAMVNVLAVLSGWEFARQRVRRVELRGFPIDPTPPDDSARVE